MSVHQIPSSSLPFKFEEVKDEEVSQLPFRRLNNNNRYVRARPGNTLLPYAFVNVADHFYNFEFRQGDVLIATFPKSGTVWTAEIVWALTHFNQLHRMDSSKINFGCFFLDADLLHPPTGQEETPLTQRFRETCPDGNIEDGIMLQLAKAENGARVMKTHLPFQFFNQDLLVNSKVVYVVRNPKDVCVSLYFFLKGKSNTTVDGDFTSFAQSFMKNHINFGPYWTHIQQAWTLRNHPNFHLIFYEDMKENVMEELRKLNMFLHLELTEENLQSILEATTFESMKSRDLQGPIVAVAGGFFRKGVVGDWKNMASTELDVTMNHWIEEHSKSIGIKFKYA